MSYSLLDDPRTEEEPCTLGGENSQTILLPVEIVRETEPGSGEFVNILNGGSGGRQIGLPVYQPDSGNGRGESTTLEPFDYQIDTGGSFNSGSVDTITVQLTNVTGSWNGTLTETGNSTGVFENTGAGVTVTLSPVPTLSASEIDDFVADIDASALGLSGLQLTLTETSENSDDFKAAFHTASASLSSALSISQADTIQITITDLGNGNEIELDLTETGDDTKTFSDGTTTLVASSLNTTGSIDALEAHVISPLFNNQPQAVSLKETAAGSLFFNNLNVSQTSITPEDPASNGQGVFYVRIPKIGDTQEIKLRSGSNELAINATVDPNDATKLITGKLALIPDEVSASFSGVDVLQMAAGATNIAVDILGGEIETAVTKGAYLARCFAGGLDSLAYPGGHMKRIEEPVTKKLGYTATRDESTTLSDMQDALPNYSLFYFFGHGGFDGTEFVGMRVWSNGIPLVTKKVTVTPSIISNSVGENEYRLAFVNGCSSADGGTVANAYPDAFNTDAYVGWTQTANTIIAAGAGEDFFNGLDEEQTVQQAIIFAQNNGASSVTNLTATRGASERIDLTP